MATIKNAKKAQKLNAPAFVLSHIEDVRVDSFLHDKPALVEINAPRALIQSNGEGQIQGIAWMLRQPLYAAAPGLLEALEGLSGTLTTMNRDYKPEQVWALLDAWNVKARAAILKAQGQEGK